MNVVVMVAVIMAGRALSLAVYQATWRNGLERSFRRGGALVTFLMRPRWWPLHLLWCLALPHADWESLPTVKPWAIAACVTLALSAVGRLGAVDMNRFFLMDRLLVLLLAIGVVFSPLWIYPCLIAVCCLQYNGSGWGLSPGYSNLLGFEFMRGSVCVLAGCIMMDGGLAMTRDTRLGVDAWMIAVVLGYQATVYVMQAMAKSALGPGVFSWVFRNRPHYLPVNAHLRGWCPRGWRRRTLLAAAALLGRHRVLACAMVWLIEAGWLLVLADSRVAAVWLVLTILFHVLVFLLTGLFAWQFVVMHLVMLVWVLPQAGPAGIFGWHQTGAVAVAALMAGALVGLLRKRALQECRENARPGRSIGWLDAADLLMAWWDGPYMRMYSWQGETSDGRRVSIPVTALSPHDTFLTDIQTHLMVLGLHNNLDPRTASDRTIARTGVWGLLVDSRERDHLYRLADGEVSKPPDLNAREKVVPRSYRLTEMAPPETEALRGLFLGINAYLHSQLFRTVMRWPHFPGEDWVPDVCPLGGVLPCWQLDVPLASVSLVRVRTFQHREAFGLLEYEVVWTMSLE